jgi:hypothetical protein
MSDPYISLFDVNDILVGPSNPIIFGLVSQGSFSDIKEVRIWNDRYNNQGSERFDSPKISAVPIPGDTSQIFYGTELNRYVPMLEARSCDAYGTVPDMMSVWTPIGPMSFLTIGNLPSGCGRRIEMRLSVPQDAVIFAVKTFSLRITS